MENQKPAPHETWGESQAYNSYVAGNDVDYIEVEQPIRALTIVPPRTQLSPRSNLGLIILLATVLGGGFVLRNVFANIQRATPIAATANVADAPIASAILSLPATIVAPDGVQVALPMPPTATPPSVPETVVASDSATNSDRPSAQPVWGNNYVANDGLPTFICGGDNTAAFLLLVQMQAAGKDVAYGFHLGLIPYDLRSNTGLASRAAAEDALRAGTWDCETSSVDRVAQSGHAVVTILADASAGAHGIWARDIASLEQLRGKRVAFVRQSSAEYFLHAVLQQYQIDPAELTLLPVETIGQATGFFVDGSADAVAGWLPSLDAVVANGGKPVITTEQLPSIFDVVAVSRHVIDTHPALVQAFHNAWFDTLRVQLDAPWDAAQKIASWGRSDWTGIRAERALADMRTMLRRTAQANLMANTQVMSRPAALLSQLRTAQGVWQVAGVSLPLGSPETLIDTRFVLRTAQTTQLRSVTAPLNPTFALAMPTLVPSLVTLPTAAPASNATPALAGGVLTNVVVLPCKRFSFLPDSAILTLESRSLLDSCVLPTLRQQGNISLRVVGSAAWPGPKGTYTEAQIRELARARAQAVADYLASQQVPISRFVVDAVIPPAERREIDDINSQNLDRYVEMTILTAQ